MNIVTEVNEWRKIRETLRDCTVGFIPTMGNLHAGHLSLCKRAKLENEVTVISIFINPTQFNDSNDFDKYPRTYEQDVELLKAQEVDYLFFPKSEALYPDQYEVQVTETVLSQELEGLCRPGHFNGMLTIVLKLLNLISPNKAYFGKKDYQQFLLVKKMCEALFLPIQIIPCATQRAEDGLALSSRNNRLSAEDRLKASYFSKILHSDFPHDQKIEKLISHGFKVDYIAEKWQRLLGAVYLGDIRLIDNVSIYKEEEK